jgi:hypothetical protein
MAFALFGVPGIYLALKGPLYGDEAAGNRRTGIVRAASGMALLAVAGVANFFLLSMAEKIGFGWILWTGGLGMG